MYGKRWFMLSFLTSYRAMGSHEVFEGVSCFLVGVLLISKARVSGEVQPWCRF